jgi:hypothetical protein
MKVQLLQSFSYVQNLFFYEVIFIGLQETSTLQGPAITRSDSYYLVAEGLFEPVISNDKKARYILKYAPLFFILSLSFNYLAKLGLAKVSLAGSGRK